MGAGREGGSGRREGGREWAQGGGEGVGAGVTKIEHLHTYKNKQTKNTSENRMKLRSEKHETGVISYKFLRGWGGGEMRVVRGRGVVAMGRVRKYTTCLGEFV